MSKELSCPFGHVCDQCILFQERIGEDDKKQPVVRRDCAINWIAEFGLENAKMSHGTGRAVESFREEVVKGNQQLATALAGPNSMRRIANESR